MTKAIAKAGEWIRAPLPADIAAVCKGETTLYCSAASKCRVLVSREPRIGWHLSISHPWRYPSWEEIKSARYQLTPPHVVMAMMLPPTDQFVNVHKNCFHLFECRCEASGAMR